jgi:23S rRNA pseudouridine1911/1915/1917 synthase
MQTGFFHPCWPVLYEDNHLLGLYKPAGLLVQGDHTGDMCLPDLAKQWIKERYKKPGEVFIGMVHRLDRPAAGAVLFARTSKAASRLSLQFRERRIKKVYWAVVEGRIQEPEGKLRQQIVRRGKNSAVAEISDIRTQEAGLNYRVLRGKENWSLVEIELLTGRRHQIRLQMSALGHPILGDLRYGASEPLPNRQIALLAKELGVEHPTRKERIVLQSPIPKEWHWLCEDTKNSPVPWAWEDMRKLTGFE